MNRSINEWDHNGAQLITNSGTDTRLKSRGEAVIPAIPWPIQ